MKTSQTGLNLIKKYEGLKLKPYKCPAGVLTVGYGHTKDVKEGQSITERQAEELLKEDLFEVEKYLGVNLPYLNQNQYDALASFIFNLGLGNFKNSTLFRKIKNSPADPTIKDEFQKWVFASGKKLPGLVKRREEEANLYFK